MTAQYFKHTLQFKQASGTSRGILKTKDSWFLKVTNGDAIGIGECGLLKGLSVDDRKDYEYTLNWVCSNIHLGLPKLYKKLEEFPSIQFGLEMAFKSLESEHPYELFPSDFTKGNDSIPINGLVWMGEKSFMKSQIETKIKEGFKCIKLKIGAIDFQSEIELLKYIRSQFSEKDIEIRVDANGAFSTKDVLEKLKTLSEFKLHSIEQPIQQGQWQEMAKLCEKTPLDIALDEELIGVFKSKNKSKLLNTIKPQYIILKPSLIGGFKGSKSWISLARSLKVGWWLTSALESNVGLNAISQFTYNLDTSMYQGLGTGSLYTNNFESPLYIKKGHICYDPNLNWNVSFKD
ncbi:o-succinylbenzoate synthase [Croceibacter atlanticus]|uniref:o-succinylbenzoate synthase n=1 Tax=Croceibacter atlanticus TaxID=313588 RepID=UPI000C8A94DC|nr:o-succinylbenzoate synthase [Croceibacter sp.]WSP34278.1 o-succinylbenzoate synthase [Croceibacter atlanticus]